MPVPWWGVVLLAIGGGLAAAAIVALRLRRDARVRSLSAEFARLSWRQRFAVAWRIARDPRLGLRARLLLFAIAAYLVLPVDVVPDFVPVLGQLDDLVVLAVALWLLVRLVPLALLREHLERAQRG